MELESVAAQADNLMHSPWPRAGEERANSALKLIASLANIVAALEGVE